MVKFSADESTVTIIDGPQLYNIPRPLVVPWNYTPAGVTYWLSPAGNDWNAGTQASPFATVRHFVSICKPGDQLNILPGDYWEGVLVPSTVAGTEAAPITITCAPIAAGGGLGSVRFHLPQAKALGDSSTEPTNTAVFCLHNPSYIQLNGLVLIGALGQPWAPPLISGQNPQGNPNGITWENGPCTGCSAMNCLAMLCLHCGLKDQSGATNGLTIKGNICYRNGRTTLDHGIYMPGSNAAIDGNVFFANYGYGAQLYSKPTGCSFTRNASTLNGWGGLALYGPANKIYNNTLANNGVVGVQMGGAATGNDCQDNISWGHARDVDFSFTTGNNWDYCIHRTVASGTAGPHCLQLDPLLLGPSLLDCRLKPFSPAIGAGVDAGFGKNLGPY